jgi:5-formyltetrahydrofolate cyclo-ligase
MDAPELKAWRAKLRAELIARRMAVDSEVHARWSAAIARDLGTLLEGIAPRRIVGFCWPYQAEFDARPVVERCLARGVRAALPVVVAPRTPMIFRQWTAETKLAPGVYDIPAPVDTAEVVPDVVLAPLAGFDEQGYRLGYGGGFFDRTLGAMARRPLAIGVGFELGRVATIYPQWHDAAMDYVVTETGTYRREASGLVPVRAVALPLGILSTGFPSAEAP